MHLSELLLALKNKQRLIENGKFVSISAIPLSIYFSVRPKRLELNRHKIKILIKPKDVLENLLIQDGFRNINILPQERGKTKLSIAFSLLKRNLV